MSTTAKRAREEEEEEPREEPKKKKQRVNKDKSKKEKKKKKREVYDRSSIFLRDESTARNGVLTLADAPGTSVPNLPSTLVAPRGQQTSASLMRDTNSRPHIQSALFSSTMIKERPLVELLGAAHLPSVITPQGAAVTGIGTSPHGVPIEEALITLIPEYKRRASTMHDLRVAFGLPTSLENASESVRLASGTVAVDFAKIDTSTGQAVSNSLNVGTSNSTSQSERENRLPSLVGLPAVTLAKTRDTYRPQGQLINTHGFAHESSRKVTVTIKASFDADSAKYYAEFFKDDPTPTTTVKVKPGEKLQPEDFAVFQQLKREHGDRFNRRLEYMEKAASMMPRPVMHEINWGYVLANRFPARGMAFGEPPCSLDNICCGMQLARAHGTEVEAPTMAFYYPSEREEYARTGKLPEGPRLCFDDMIKALARAAMKPNANLEEPIVAINPFCIICEKGRNFDPHYAIPTTVGNGTRKTGIWGFVPRYSSYLRHFVLARRPGESASTPPVRMLADITPIF